MVERTVTHGDARAEILSAIATALRGEPRLPPPEIEPIFAADVVVDGGESIARFRRELEAVDGKIQLVASPDELAQAVAAYCSARQFKRIAFAQSPLVRRALELVPP